MIVEAIFFLREPNQIGFSTAGRFGILPESHERQADHIPIICRINKTNKLLQGNSHLAFLAQFFCEFTCINFNQPSELWASQLLQAAVSANLRGRRVNLPSFTPSVVSIHQHFQGTTAWNIVNRHIKVKLSPTPPRVTFDSCFTSHIQVCWNGCSCVYNPCSCWRGDV